MQLNANACPFVPAARVPSVPSASVPSASVPSASVPSASVPDKRLEHMASVVKEEIFGDSFHCADPNDTDSFYEKLEYCYINHLLQKAKSRKAKS
jgi:hypothetical protein